MKCTTYLSQSGRLALWLALAVPVLHACKSSVSASTSSTDAGVAAATGGQSSAPAGPPFRPIDPAKVGMPCKDTLDCPPVGSFKSSCNFRCEKPASEPVGNEGYCQLVTLTGAVGAFPCTGHRLGVTQTGGASPPGRTPATYVCDVNAGVFCEPKSQRCVAVKAVGAPCGDGPEDCGKDAFCDPAKKVCVAAAEVGASCKDLRCRSTAYCDKNATCVARLPDLATCTASSECQSLACASAGGAMICKPAAPLTPCLL